MSIVVNKKISSFIERMLPNHFFENEPEFASFLGGYLEFLEQSGNPYDVIQGLQNDGDINKSITKYAAQFKDTYLPFIPQKALDQKYSAPETLARLITNIKDFYSQKGTEQSARWFFSNFFDQSVEIHNVIPLHYDIRSPNPISETTNSFMKNIHPAGMEAIAGFYSVTEIALNIFRDLSNQPDGNSQNDQFISSIIPFPRKLIQGSNPFWYCRNASGVTFDVNYTILNASGQVITAQDLADVSFVSLPSNLPDHRRKLVVFKDDPVGSVESTLFGQVQTGNPIVQEQGLFSRSDTLIDTPKTASIKRADGTIKTGCSLGVRNGGGRWYNCSVWAISRTERTHYISKETDHGFIHVKNAFGTMLTFTNGLASKTATGTMKIINVDYASNGRISAPYSFIGIRGPKYTPTVSINKLTNKFDVTKITNKENRKYLAVTNKYNQERILLGAGSVRNSSGNIVLLDANTHT